MQRCEVRLLAILALRLAVQTVGEQVNVSKHVVQDEDRLIALTGLRGSPSQPTALHQHPAAHFKMTKASPVSVVQIQHRSKTNSTAVPANMPTTVHIKIAGNGYAQGSPLYEHQQSLNGTVNGTVNDTVNGTEVEFSPSEGPERNKILLSIINMLALGLIGVDRCFMGQIGWGVVKGLTGGGLGIWFLADYAVITWSCLLRYRTMNALGMSATFTDSHARWAFWITLVCLLSKVASAVYYAWRRNKAMSAPQYKA